MDIWTITDGFLSIIYSNLYGYLDGDFKQSAPYEIISHIRPMGDGRHICYRPYINKFFSIEKTEQMIGNSWKISLKVHFTASGYIRHLISKCGE